MSAHYDRQGRPICLMCWARLFEQGLEYRQVAKTNLPGSRRVSTIWLGLDHSFGDGPPLIFETMAFGLDEDLWGEIQERYSTEEQALAGHAEVVRSLQPFSRGWWRRLWQQVRWEWSLGRLHEVSRTKAAFDLDTPEWHARFGA